MENEPVPLDSEGVGLLTPGCAEVVRSSALRISREACCSSSSLVSNEDIEPRFEVDGVVGLVGGPELSDAFELERDGAPPLGVLPGDVILEGENMDEDAEEGGAEWLSG